MKLKILLVGIVFSSFLKAQDARIYSQRDYTGTQHNLTIGQTITMQSSGNGSLSIRIYNSNAGVKVKLVTPPGNYPEISFYTEINTPFAGGTNQYENQLLEISCVSRYIPQPKIFIPIDRTNLHPGVTNPPIAPLPNKRMLMLKKANFWENSEDIVFNLLPGDVHGPFGEIVAVPCDPNVMDYTYQELHDDQSLWEAEVLRSGRRIPGHAWDYDYNIPYVDDPRNEWIDNWWGSYYSNMGLFDWGSRDELALIIVEADGGGNEEDVLGRALIRKDMEGCILIKCRMFGWIVVQNIDIGSSGSEPSVDVGERYLYNNWNLYTRPEEYYGPGPNWGEGTQYLPWGSISEIETKASPNDIIGVLGNGIISAPNTLSVPMTYRAAASNLCGTYSYVIDWNGTCTADFSRSTINNVSGSGATISNTDVDACGGLVSWTIQVGCNWVSVNDASGTGDFNDLEITVEPNCTIAARSCTLSIGNNDLVINQQAGSPANCTSIEELSAITNLKIFPNPNNGLFTVQLETRTSQEIQIAILNLIGQSIFETEGYQISGQYNKDIDLRDTASGMYFVHIRVGKERVIAKIIVRQ